MFVCCWKVVPKLKLLIPFSLSLTWKKSRTRRHWTTRPGQRETDETRHICRQPHERPVRDFHKFHRDWCLTLMYRTCWKLFAGGSLQPAHGEKLIKRRMSQGRRTCQIRYCFSFLPSLSWFPLILKEEHKQGEFHKWRLCVKPGKFQVYSQQVGKLKRSLADCATHSAPSH